MIALLPEGYASRQITTNDLDAAVALMRTCEIADEGSSETTADDVRTFWNRPRFDLARDAGFVIGPSGDVVGYFDVWAREGYTVIYADGYVHPEHRGRGLGRWIVQTAEARAREVAEHAPSGERVILHNTIAATQAEACALLESEGYSPGRYFWRMVIEMEAPPPSPVWPEGVRCRRFRPGEETAVHEVVMSGFGDNYGHQWSPFDEWRGVMMESESFNPDLWFLAVADAAASGPQPDGGREGGASTIVGVVLCPDYEEGWVRQVAVKRDWRGRGIALALLHEAFGELYRRGKRTVGLVVDSYNRTGARSVYERAGMHEERTHIAYEKVLREGDATSVGA